MVGSRAEKLHKSRVGKNWVIMGFWKKSKPKQNTVKGKDVGKG